VSPTFSVVTPTLNQASFLPETLASVRLQEEPLEHVVVDGGSSDGTLDLLAKAPGLRFVSVPGEGQSAAVNRGVAMTSGEILGWLNSDDTYLPGALAAVARHFSLHPEVDVVYGDCVYRDGAGRRLGPYPTGPFEPGRSVEAVQNPVPQPAAFLRRRAFLSASGLDPRLHYAMDFDLWLRLASLGAAFAYLPSALATLRLHPAAKSVSSLAEVAPEIVAVVEGALARGGLALRPERARSNAHYRAAQLLFWSGRDAEARGEAIRALRASPSNLRPTLAYALLGSPARALLARLRGNPFAGGAA
jgi:hypothetical protein